MLLAGFWTSCSGIPDSPSYNILVFLPAEIKSHFNGFKPLLEALVARGHNLTLVSPFTLGSTNKGGPPLSYTHVPVEITAKGSGVRFWYFFYSVFGWCQKKLNVRAWNIHTYNIQNDYTNGWTKKNGMSLDEHQTFYSLYCNID